MKTRKTNQRKLSEFTTEERAYLLPILLDKELKRRVVYLIQKAASKKVEGVKNVYVWNKLSDPQVHPNDYVKFEDPNTITLDFLLTSCKGIYPLRNLRTLSMDGENVLMNANEELKERSAELSEADDDFDEIFEPKALTEAREALALQEPVVPLDETSSVDSEEDFTGMKIHEVFAKFQAMCCKRHKKCQKQHYLIGRGKIVINEKTYSGLHIYLYPDPHYDQVDLPEENIKDKLYLRFQKEKNDPDVLERSEEYKKQYLSNFSALVAQL